jgi:hypothetical protein
VTPLDLRAMVAVMRELGVAQADGIVLGPEPTKAQATIAKASAGVQVDPEELARAKRQQALEEARQEIRDKVGADLSDEECDRMLPAEMRSVA